MATFNVTPAYFRHIKTARLKLALGKEADVYPLRLWSFLTEFDPDNGTCRDLTLPEVEAMLGWTGDSGKLVDTLIRVGYLEESPEGMLRAHDWTEHEGHLKAYRERAKAASDRRWSNFPAPRPPEKATQEARHGAIDPEPIPTQPPLLPEALGARAMAAFMELGKCQRLLPLLPEVVKAWADAYPDVDLCAEIRKADAWAVTNKITRSAKGWGKTMNTWLSKEQDRVRATPKNAGAAAPVRGKYGNL